MRRPPFSKQTLLFSSKLHTIIKSPLILGDSVNPKRPAPVAVARGEECALEGSRCAVAGDDTDKRPCLRLSGSWHRGPFCIGYEGTRWRRTCSWGRSGTLYFIRTSDLIQPFLRIAADRGKKSPFPAHSTQALSLARRSGIAAWLDKRTETDDADDDAPTRSPARRTDADGW